MPQIIPLQAVASQTVSANLNGQACGINVYQRSTGLFLDLAVDDAPIIGGVLCLNGRRIVLSKHLGFAGDLAFVDTQGGADPDYAGLGARFVLAFLTPADLGWPA